MTATKIDEKYAQREGYKHFNRSFTYYLLFFENFRYAGDRLSPQLYARERHDYRVGASESSYMPLTAWLNAIFSSLVLFFIEQWVLAVPVCIIKDALPRRRRMLVAVNSS